MDNKQFSISGRLTPKNGHQSVHGLRVELITRGDPVEKVLSSDLVEESGAFHVVVPEDVTAALARDKARTVIRVVDRDGSIAWRSSRSFPVRAGKTVRLDTSIGRRALAEHNRLKTSFRQVRGDLGFKSRMEEIRRAVHMGWGADSPKARELLSILDCLEPGIGRFSGILDLARGTLDGDPLQIRHFRDVLDQLSYRVTVPPTRFAHRTDRVPVSDRGSFLRDHNFLDRNAVSAAENRWVDDDQAVLLLAAAVEASQGDKNLLDRNLRVLNAQLTAFGRLAALHRGARSALTGDAGGMTYFGELLDFLGRECPPFDVPFPDLDDDFRDPHIDPTLFCVFRGIEALEPEHHQLRYTIGDVTPNDACSGQSITISGINFGTGSTFSGLVESRVRFTRTPVPGAPSYIDVPANFWSDTSISVTVPAEATAGPLKLRIKDGSVPFCHMWANIFRSGDPWLFGGGGAPVVTSFTVNRDTGPVAVSPNSTVTLAWAVSGSVDSVSIELVPDPAGVGPFSDLEAEGTLALPVGNDFQTFLQTIRLTATNSCGSSTAEIQVALHRVAEVFATGMEVTQATQYLRADEHMVRATARRPDNSVPLVSGKPTLVRVYFASDQIPGFNGGSVQGVETRLRGYHLGQELPGSPLVPMTDPVTAERTNSVAAQRGDITRSANFQLPTLWTTQLGPITLEATLSIAEGFFDRVDEDRRRITLSEIRFLPVRPLDVVVMTVNYTGPLAPAPTPPGVNGAPTRQQAIATINTLRGLYPTHRIRFFVPSNHSGTITVSQPMDQPDLFGREGWTHVIDEMQQIALGVITDGDMIWCGVAHANVPIFNLLSFAGFSAGRGTGSRPFALGYAAFRDGDRIAGAHEIGHAFDRQHAEDDPGFSSSADAGHVNSNSFTEFGVDVERFFDGGANVVFDPTLGNAGALMSGTSTGRQWVSPYTYMGLLQKHFLPDFPSPEVQSEIEACTRVYPKRQMSESLVIQGILDPKAGSAEITRVHCTPRYPLPGAKAKRTTGYVLAVIGVDGAPLGTSPIPDHTLCGVDTNGLPPEHLPKGPMRFLEVLPYGSKASAVEIWHDGKILARLNRPDTPPRLDKLELVRESRRWELRWDANAPDISRLRFAVWGTSDDGASWILLGEDLSENRFYFDPKNYVGGKTCRLRVDANDGFNTVSAETDSFSLPGKAIDILLLSHKPGEKVDADVPTRLEVCVMWPLGAGEPESVRWTNDKGKEIGREETLWVSFPEGRHELMVDAQTQTGCRGEFRFSLQAVSEPGDSF